MTVTSQCSSASAGSASTSYASTGRVRVLVDVTSLTELVGGISGVGNMAVHGARLTLEEVAAWLRTSQTTALLLKVGHVNCGQSGCAVVLGSAVVSLVDRYSGVHDVRFNGLAVNDRLNVLVDVVVNVLAGNSWRY